MAQTHVVDQPLAGSLESTLRQAATAGLIVNGDLATSEAAVLAAVTARGAKAHVTLQPLVESLKKAIPMIKTVTGDATLVTGGSLANIYAAIPGDWAGGFPATL